MVCTNRASGHPTFRFYDKEWNFLDLEIQYPSDKSHEIPKPNCLEQMLLLSHKLSEGIPHVRTDFYCINDNLYFGELTFFHEAGLGTFRPVEWDKYLYKILLRIFFSIIFFIEYYENTFCNP